MTTPCNLVIINRAQKISHTLNPTEKINQKDLACDNLCPRKRKKKSRKGEECAAAQAGAPLGVAGLARAGRLRPSPPGGGGSGHGLCCSERRTKASSSCCSREPADTRGEATSASETCPPVRGRARSHQPGGLRAGRGARGRSAPSSRRRSRADAGSAVGRSGRTGHPVSEAHLGSRREEACLPGPWEDMGMCGGQLGGGRCRLREPLEPAQPVRVSGVFTAPKETGLAVADWGISGCKGQCAQDRRVTTALGGTVLHPG